MAAGALPVLTPWGLQGQQPGCNECITQVNPWTGDDEHGFGNTPDDTYFEGDHEGLEGGRCSQYHSAWDGGGDGCGGLLARFPVPAEWVGALEPVPSEG